VTEIVEGLGRPERDRVTTLRKRGEFFWIDVSLNETELADLGKALDIPERTLHQLASEPTHRGSRGFYADGQFVVSATAATSSPPRPQVTPPIITRDGRAETPEHDRLSATTARHSA
jgi:Mg2+ and Co2+ transporter CorA